MIQSLWSGFNDGLFLMKSRLSQKRRHKMSLRAQKEATILKDVLESHPFLKITTRKALQSAYERALVQANSAKD